MNTLNAIVNVLTEMDSVMLILVAGGLVGLVLQRIIGVFVKPNYYSGNH
jgi:hypothetical protein